MKKLLDDISGDDILIFNEIEKIRESIKEKNIKIDFLDFGAGDPNDNRDNSQMSEGVKTTKYTKQLCQIGLKGEWAQLMYTLIKKYKPNNILELGTCCGFSSIYMAKANPSSNIYTIEGACEVANIASNNINQANVTNINQIIGKFDDVLASTLKDIKQIDFAFIDGHRDKDATIRYFGIIKPFLSQNAIVVFDDISWSDGMKECWTEIIKDKDIKSYENLEKLGICYL